MSLSEEEGGRGRSVSPRRHARQTRSRNASLSPRWRSPDSTEGSSRSSSLHSWPSHRESRSPSPPLPASRTRQHSLRRSSRSLSPPPRAFPSPLSRHAVLTEPVRLYLGHLAVGTGGEDIRRFFKRENIAVLDVSLFTRFEPCFVSCTVASAAEADHAIRFLDQSILNYRRVKVNRVTHVEGTSTLPRIVIEGLPAEFDTIDVFRLAEEHAKDPHRVTCELRETSDGEKCCTGSFRVQQVWEADKAVKSLRGALGMFEQLKVRWDYGEAEDAQQGGEGKAASRRAQGDHKGRHAWASNRRPPYYSPRPPHRPPPPSSSFSHFSPSYSSRSDLRAPPYLRSYSPSVYRPPISRRPSPPRHRSENPSSRPRGRDYPYPRSSPPPLYPSSQYSSYRYEHTRGRNWTISPPRAYGGGGRDGDVRSTSSPDRGGRRKDNLSMREWDRGRYAEDSERWRGESDRLNGVRGRYA